MKNMDTHRKGCAIYLDSFLRAADVLVAYHLCRNKSRQAIVHSCTHTNCLARTASIIKMRPHLHTNKIYKDGKFPVDRQETFSFVK